MTLFIAEIGSNHNRQVQRLEKLIDKAKEIDCWAVKFQFFRAEDLFFPKFNNHIYKMSKWELPEQDLAIIRERCKKLDLKFICTLFHPKHIEYLTPHIDFLKIGSYELNYFPLLTTIIQAHRSQIKIPWIYSAGMSANICDAIWPITFGYDRNNPPYAVLHCVSNYPAKPEHCNLSRIREIKEAFICPVKVGWSDHTRNEELVLTAIAQGAEIVEFHFDLEDGKGFESEFGHCWKPSEAKRLINRAKFLEKVSSYYKYKGKKEWIYSESDEKEASKWKMDPEDGMRPLKRYREELLKCQH